MGQSLTEKYMDCKIFVWGKKNYFLVFYLPLININNDKKEKFYSVTKRKGYVFSSFFQVPGSPTSLSPVWNFRMVSLVSVVIVS